ncbi:MAG: ChaN family lipoprotein, partial [Bdellovibrionota bacterium]
MDTQAHRKLLRLQKKIFNSLKAESERLLGETPEAIRTYEREFQRDFQGAATRLAPVGKPELIEEIRRADVTFIADFHTFVQAQKTSLRLMRDAVKPDEIWYVGLELIPSHHQRALDRFQAGKLSLEKFHRTIRYREEWGFPWKHYAPIFKWARDSGVRLIALNRPRALSHIKRKRHSDLHERDQWAAGIITDVLADERGRGRRARMIVLYGELHVSSSHLPAQLAAISRAYLKQPLRSVTIHQNHDELYWRLARQGRELQVDGVRLRRGAYCVFPSTPWNKLQSLVSWFEGGVADLTRPPDLDGEGEEATDSDTDYLSMMRIYARTLSEFLGVADPSFDGLSVRTIDEADFVEGLAEDHVFTPKEHRLIRYHVLSNHRLYIPRAQVAYLGTASQNAAAELAAIHLLRTETRIRDVYLGTRDDFFRMVLEWAFGFFGSLVLNPRRKCDLPSDHSRRLRQLASDAEPEAFEYERLARTLALHVIEEQRRAIRGKPTPLSRLERSLQARGDAPAIMLAARYVGY